MANKDLRNLPWVITHGDNNDYTVAYVPRSALFAPAVETRDQHQDVRYGFLTELCQTAENIYPNSLGGPTHREKKTTTFVGKYSHLKPIYDLDSTHKKANKNANIYIPLSCMADYLSNRIDSIINKKARVGDENIAEKINVDLEALIKFKNHCGFLGFSQGFLCEEATTRKAVKHIFPCLKSGRCVI